MLVPLREGGLNLSNRHVDTSFMAIRRRLSRIADKVTALSGSVWAGLAAFIVVVTWAATGPVFHYSSTWQLVINTGTTIVTFLMVFLIQHTTNREALALHAKLDGLIAASEAQNELMGIESESEEVIEERRNEATP